MKVSEMRREEMARPHARAAEIEAIEERAAPAEQLLFGDKHDEVALEQARALLARLEQADFLAEWERNAAGVAPCMRIAPWKGNRSDGD
jgi:hypothetical protein